MEINQFLIFSLGFYYKNLNIELIQHYSRRDFRHPFLAENNANRSFSTFHGKFGLKSKNTPKPPFRVKLTIVR
jgi:hypothetical protein